MAAIDAGLQVTPWPACIPDDRREAIRRRTSLRDRLVAFLECYKRLAPQERHCVRQAVDDQSAFAELFNGQRAAELRDDLPQGIGLAAERLFEKAFEMLGPLGIRDHNYEKFIELVEHRVCPFCGCEYFEGVQRNQFAAADGEFEGRREPLDHYLALSRYPFAGANARNLLPMGWKCNSSFKLAQDILRAPSGERRLCFDPYDAAPVTVSLGRTRLFARLNDFPQWEVDLVGEPERVATWDAVFNVKNRYIDHHLDSIYDRTIKEFGAVAKRLPHMVAEGVLGGFIHLKDISDANGITDRAFLLSAVYDLLIQRCREGGEEAERIAAKYRDAVLYAG